jgi:serine/threonine-protein kinase
MGEVYRARDTRLGRDVAVKILPASFAADSESVRRFEKEAHAVASLSHPNIVTLLDVGEEQGVRYAVAELVAGETLRTRMAGGALSSREAAEIAAQIADGLAAAHEKGVVHRDIKPENVVITPSGFARILDFGLAKRSAPAIGASEDEATRSALMTEPGIVAGTVGYMSPEQVRGETVDGRSDIFALGVVLWEMLTGRRPFSGDSHVETLNAILKEEPQPELALDSLPADLARIVRRCLEKRKEARYHSAADLAHDLRSAIQETRTSATRTAGSVPRPARAPRKALLAAGAVLAVAIAAAVLVIARRGSGGPSATPPPPRTLAVLPFRAISAEGMPEHFGLGLADSLIGRLASLRELTVRPTSAIARYETVASDATEVGRRLGVDAVLEGTYQRLEGMTRVTVQMTEVSRGGLLWSDRIDLPEGKLFELQDTISRQVAEKLRIELGPEMRRTLGPRETVPDRVMEQYLAARAKLIHASSSDASIRQEMTAAFDPIIEQQPSFAPAIGARAYARAWLTFVRPSDEGYRAALADADRASELDPDLAEPRVARASLAWSSLGGWDVVRAVRDLKHAAEKSPSLELAYFDLARIYLHNGWFSEFEEAMRAGERINPTSNEINRQRAVFQAWIGNTRKAVELFEGLPGEVRQLWGLRWQWMGLRSIVGNPRDVEPEVEAVMRETTVDLRPTYAAILAILRARQGRDFIGLEREALAIDQRMGHFHHVYHFLADAHAQAGNAPRAAELLRRAGETGMPCAACFENDPLLRPIQGSKEFAAAHEEIERRSSGYRAALKDVP